MKIHTLFIAILFSGLSSLNAQSDYLLYQDFLNEVRQYHPVAKQANLLIGKANAQKLSARGGFDPKLGVDWQGKLYESKTYYNNFYSELKVPTAYALEFKAAYETATGLNVNPEDKVPSAGLATLGLSLPVLQGLLTDERRTALRQAELMQASSDWERRLALNDLLRDAADSYWDWVESQQAFIIAQEALRLAEERLEGLKMSVVQGDRPGIDTIEARAFAQERQIQAQQAFADYQAASFYLSGFRWTSQNATVAPDKNQAPPPNLFVFKPFEADSLKTILSALNEQHPALQVYDYKLEQLSAERRLAANKLLPKVNLSYNVLAKQFNYFDTSPYMPLTNNFKWGITASAPLFMRQERGKLQLTDIKIQETALQITQKRIDLSNKLQAAYAKYNALVDQIAVYDAAVQNYQTLLQGEQQRFQIGESSVFLINSREVKRLEAEQKRLALRMKCLRLQTELTWAAGML